jgi:hypothetical protein
MQSSVRMNVKITNLEGVEQDAEVIINLSVAVGA